MQHWFRHLGRRLGRGRGQHQAKPGRHIACEDLSQVEAESSVTITCNTDHKTVERGLYVGVQVMVLRNEPDEPNLIVAVGDARYVLDRRIARRIKVQV